MGQAMDKRTTIGDIMTRNAFTVDIEDTVHKADSIMHDENVKQVAVLEGKKFVGIITERSIMEYSLRKLYDFDDTDMDQNKIIDFEKIMTRDCPVVYPEDSLQKAIKIMNKNKTDCLPVIDWDYNLLGLIKANDLLLYLNKLIDRLEESGHGMHL